MKTFKKVVLMAVCAALLVGASVAGTLAFLQAKTDTITNTMTVGKVAITLDESVLDANGEATNNRTATGNAYKLVPGKKYIKDPQIHVDAASESCYLFVEVVNEIAAIEKQGVKVADQMATNDWIQIPETNVYYKEAAVSAGANVDVFADFTIAEDVLDLSGYADKKITITAYAVQADGFNSATAAWAATFGADQG